jgi:hypothetical protein
MIICLSYAKEHLLVNMDSNWMIVNYISFHIENAWVNEMVGPGRLSLGELDGRSRGPRGHSLTHSLSLEGLEGCVVNLKH